MAARKLNVNPDVTDIFYRYKMPALIAKVEGKGNGIKTVIPNMVEIAKALDRPPSYPTKFFGCELGAQTQVDAKNDRYIVNGAHEAEKLQEILYSFVRKFVLCSSCGNPETVLEIGKGIITSRCIACGCRGDIDMIHRLAQHILKNPPDQGKDATTTSKKKGRGNKGGGGDKQNQNNDGGEATVAVNGNGSGDDEGKETTNGVNLSEGGIFEGGTAPPPPAAEEDDDNWDPDFPATTADDEEGVGDSGVTDPAAVPNEELTGQLAKIVKTNRPRKERIDMFFKFVESKKIEKGLQITAATNEIFNEAETLDILDRAPLVLCEIFLSENILKELTQYRVLFLKFTVENARAQRWMLGGIEQVISVHKARLMPKVAHIIKQIYDQDIVVESVLLEWNKKGPSKKNVSLEVSQEIHERAQKIIDWLKEAEEESSEEEDEEEEDDGDVEFEKKPDIKTSLQQQPAADTVNGLGGGAVKDAGPAADLEAENEEDVDIDDI